MGGEGRNMPMLIVIEQLAVLYIFMALGYAFGKIKKSNSEHGGLLSFIIVNLCLPSKIFNSFSKNFTVPYIKENYKLILLGFGLLVLLVAFSFFAAKLLTKNPYERRIYRYSLTISNNAYIGYVLVEEALGLSGLTSMICFSIPFVLYTYSLGYMLITGAEGSLKKCANPMTASIVLGIIVGLSGLQLPGVISKVITTASACAGPLGMILVGLTLSAFPIKELLLDRKAYIVTALRLLVIPLMVYGLCRAFSLEYAMLYAIIVACMPCGLNTIIFPRLIGEDCTVGARLALISNALSVLTLPVWLYLIM